MNAEILLTGLEVPEGPTVLPDARIAFVQQPLGAVSVFDGTGLTDVARGPGQPNSVTLGSDGFLYVAQNGGIEESWETVRTDASIERIGFDGSIEKVVTRVAGVALQAPNDLVFGPDGRLFFTDPGEAWNLENPRAMNRLFAVGGSSAEVVLELPPSYVNGLAFTPTGDLVWVESYRRDVCILENGTRRVLCRLPELHAPDGLDVALDGRMFIATTSSHGITVLSPEGEVLDHIFLDVDALPTNCCFDGSDLVVTDFGVGFKPGDGAGRIWRVPTDAGGKPQTPGRL